MFLLSFSKSAEPGVLVFAEQGLNYRAVRSQHLCLQSHMIPILLRRMKKYSQYVKGHVGCIVGPRRSPLKDQGRSWAQWGSTFVSLESFDPIKSGKFGGTLALNGPARVLWRTKAGPRPNEVGPLCSRVLSWSKLVNFFFRPRDNG